MNYLDRLILAIETLSHEEISICFQNGINPNDLYRGKPLIEELIGGYARGPLFAECVRVFIDNGLIFKDKALLAVLSDDHRKLSLQLKSDPSAVNRTISFQTAFTPLQSTTLLHFCAEFNHVSCAKVLLAAGADSNARAGLDVIGFGGQTPVFHTVNQHNNVCIDMMHLLIKNGADVTIHVNGIIWGKGYQWETYIPAVNPVSYAMMGLLRQFQRSEPMIYEIVYELMKAGFSIDYKPPNVPNTYLLG